MPSVAVFEPVKVEGLRDLQRAFKEADAKLDRELDVTLRRVAEPVRGDAERFAVSSITRIGIPWSRMRIGITTSSVYVAPVERGRLSRRNKALARPNLAPLLLTEEVRALERNRGRIIDGVDDLLARVGRKWETA